MITAQFDITRVTRIVCLSAIYLVLVLLIGTQIDTWLIAHLSATAANAGTIDKLQQSWFPVAFPNTLVFAGSLLWFSRKRDFAPLARYFAPTLFGVAITFVILVPMLALETLGAFSELARGQFTFMMMLHFVLPGLIAAQLFRFPRRREEVSLGNAAAIQQV